MVHEADEPLLWALKSKRRELAEAAKVPAYVIFPDRTLVAMIDAKPQSLDAFAALPGVGAKKLEKFGRIFLEVLTGAPEPEVHPAKMKAAASGSADLLDQLHMLQRDLAYGIDGTAKRLDCPTTTLARIAEARPDSREALVRIKGMDEARLERFGPDFLNAIAEHG